MAQGGGRYGDICERAALETGAEGVILIVINGKLGSGFSLAVEEGIILKVSDALRMVADEIDEDLGCNHPQ